MHTTSSLCPSEKELELFLNATNHSSADPGLGDHVNACPKCQQMLEYLSNNLKYGITATPAAANTPYQSETALNDLLEQLRENPLKTGVQEEKSLAFSSPGNPEAPLGDFGHYQMLKKLGSGACGHVFLARDRKLDRNVVIKIMRPELVASPNAFSRFLREARAAASIRHRNVVAVYDVGKLPGQPPFLVMEHVPGKCLNEILAEKKSLPLLTSISIIQQVALGLSAAHDKGMVHRDIKPSNILLESHTREALVFDFGLVARPEMDSELTQEGQFLGTPAYMSPEQASGRSHEVDARSDIFSLGVVFYQLLTGQLPFTGSQNDVLYQIVTADPVPVGMKNPDIPEDLQAITMKCLAKDPAKRYSDGQQLAEELARLVNGDPVHPGKPQLGYSLASWFRRRKWAMVNGVAALLLASIAMGTFFYFTQEKVEQPKETKAPIVREKSDPKDLEKLLAKIAADPIFSMESRDPKTRYLAAALLISDYRTYRGNRETVLLHPELSEQILGILAEADWDDRKYTGPISRYKPRYIFNRLGVSKQDGFLRPRPVQGETTREYMERLNVAMREWLRENAESYRIRKYLR